MSRLSDRSTRYAVPAVLSELASLKQANMAPLWNSTRLSARVSTKEELFALTRSSFDSKDYLADLLAQTKSGQDSYQGQIVAFSAVSILSTLLVIPALPISVPLKNILGLIGLFAPLLLIGISIISPEFRSSFQKASSKPSSRDIERISYHEAGHLIAGYLLGVPILSYDISGAQDSGTTISTEMYANAEDNMLPSMDLVSALLVISMSGMVAETLRFGSSLGGSEDFSLAYSLMREYRLPSSKWEGYMRWATLSALSLMLKNRDSLDEAASAMRNGRSLLECFAAIEDGAVGQK